MGTVLSREVNVERSGALLSISIPYSFVCVGVTFLYLWAIYRPSTQTLFFALSFKLLEIREVNPVPQKVLEPFTVMHVFVLVVCLVTIVLWAIEHQIEGYFKDVNTINTHAFFLKKRVFGSTGIIALIPVVLFFAFPVLE